MAISVNPFLSLPKEVLVHIFGYATEQFQNPQQIVKIKLVCKEILKLVKEQEKHLLKCFHTPPEYFNHWFYSEKMRLDEGYDQIQCDFPVSLQMINAVIKNYPNLTRLSLSNVDCGHERFKEEFFKLISTMKNLRILELNFDHSTVLIRAWNQVFGEIPTKPPENFILCLQSCSALKHLSLSNLRLTPQHFADLNNSLTLESLKLKNSNLELGKRFHTFHIVNEESLLDGRFQINALETPENARVYVQLIDRPELKEFCLENDTVNPSQTEYLSYLFPSVEKLSFKTKSSIGGIDNDINNDQELLSSLSLLENLKELNSIGVDGLDLNEIIQIPCLVRLFSIACTLNCSEENFEELEKFTNLKNLYLETENNKIHHELLNNLASLPLLEKLKIKSIDVNNKIFSEIVRNPNLKTLILSQYYITNDEKFEPTIASSLTTLELTFKLASQHLSYHRVGNTNGVYLGEEKYPENLFFNFSLEDLCPNLDTLIFSCDLHDLKRQDLTNILKLNKLNKIVFNSKNKSNRIEIVGKENIDYRIKTESKMLNLIGKRKRSDEGNTPALKRPKFS